MSTPEYSMNDQQRSFLRDCVHDLKVGWKDLCVTDILYKMVAFVLLTPLVGLLYRVLLGFTGRTVLADEDILHFLLGPVGWITLILLGAISITIIALEMAALMIISLGARNDLRIHARAALFFAAPHALDTINVAARIVIRVVLIALPFLAVGGLVYWWLLTEYDINYYLQEKPREFWLAAVLIGAVLAALALVLLSATISWIFALPMVLFGDVSPKEALRKSREKALGHRPKIAAVIVAWLFIITAVSALITFAVGFLGKLIVPQTTGSVPLLVLAVGGMLLLLGATNLVTSLLSNTSFAVVLVNLYRRIAHPERIDVQRMIPAATPRTAAVWRLSRWKIAAACIAGVCIAAIVGAVFARSVRFEDRATITAHRGASADAPENSLAAVQRAIEDGTDWVEIDVQESKDGVVMVVHDSDLKKLGGANLKIWEATAEELRQVDIGSKFSSEFSDQRVPTLEEVLTVCKGKTKLNIELKYYGHDQKLEQRVAELVETHDMQDSVIIMSLKYDAVRKMKKLRPDWTVGLLTAVAVGDLRKNDEADFFAVNTDLATRRFIRNVHEVDKQVFVWTVNEPITMSMMAGRGVDSIITDKPALARQVLENRKTLSSIERLLIELAEVFGVEREAADRIEDF
jgi:glycerophosphoryl diester phosphodiesterase